MAVAAGQRRDHHKHDVQYCLILALLAATALRIAPIAGKPLWMDEGWTWIVATSDAPITDTIRFDGSFDPHPASYYWLMRTLHPWSTSAIWAMRLPSAVAGVLACILLWLVLREAGADPRVVFWCVVLFGVSPLPIRYAIEARAYSMGLLANLLVIWAYLRVRRRRRAPDAIALVAASAFSLTVDGLGLLAPLAVGLDTVLFAWRNRRIDWPIAGMTIAALLIASPYLIWRLELLLSTHGDAALEGAPSLWWLGALLATAPTGVSTRALEHAGLPGFLAIPGGAILLTVLAAGVRCRALPARCSHLFALYVFPALGVTGVGMTLFGLGPQEVRYYLVFAPGVTLLYVSGIVGIAERVRWARHALWVSLVLSVVATGVMLRAPGERIDWTSLAGQLEPGWGDQNILLYEATSPAELLPISALLAHSDWMGRPLNRHCLVRTWLVGSRDAETLVDENGTPLHGDSVLSRRLSHEASPVFWFVETWFNLPRAERLAGFRATGHSIAARGVRMSEWKLADSDP